ncbi:MAG: UbiA family prenyltransferase [Candidatus Zhuqueibacterota bacterium]
MVKNIQLLDYVFILRPTLFFPLWTVYLAGFHANTVFDPARESSQATATSGSHVFFIAALLTLLMGAVYIFNQIVDIKSDERNDKLFFIAKKIIDKKTATIEGVLLTVISIGTAFVVDAKVGAMFVWIFLITGILYSYKPFAWKDRPIMGAVANFLGGWSVASCGWITAGTESYHFALYSLPYGFGLVAVYLLTTIPDIPGDREFNKITFGVKFGKMKAVCWGLVFELATVVLSFILRDYLFFIPALFSLPLFIAAAATQEMKHIVRAIKFTILFVSLAVCLKFPVYFLVILFTFFFSKWYYQKRFGLNYPKFAA